MKGYLHKIGKVWYTTVDLPRLRGERRRQKEIRLGGVSKSEAQTKERQVLRDIEEQCVFEAPNTTVEQLLQSWLAHTAPTAASQPISPKTHERYVSIVRNQLIRHLGTIPLRKLNPRHITEMQTTLRQQGLSGTTCLHVHRVLHTALNFGVRSLHVVKSNAASAVRPPRASIRRLYVDEQSIRMLLAAANGTRLEVPVMLAAVTGVRRGELLALCWQDIDFERKRLVVSRSLEETKAFGLRFKAPKSGHVRVVPIADSLLAALSTHKERQNADRRRLESAYADHGLVFCNEDGSPWAPDTLTKQFAAIAKRIGLKGFRLHDVRHGFASISLKQGTSVKEVSELLGHSSPLITLSTYAHTMEGVARNAVNRLADSLVEASRGEQSVRKCEKSAVVQ
ncbi:MAG: site-specific integrase [Candidatus Eremiobacteraeota bacterium]|nr:site-specific integrase [Candidatus Eremiobacteraeota bacterium]